MKDLQEATEKICELKGSLVAMDALLVAIVQVLPPAAREQLRDVFLQHAEVARTVLLHAAISEHTIAAFERDTERCGHIVELPARV
jgi:hypothetical protein